MYTLIVDTDKLDPNKIEDLELKLDWIKVKWSLDIDKGILKIGIRDSEGLKRVAGLLYKFTDIQTQG